MENESGATLIKKSLTEPIKMEAKRPAAAGYPGR